MPTVHCICTLTFWRLDPRRWYGTLFLRSLFEMTQKNNFALQIKQELLTLVEKLQDMELTDQEYAMVSAICIMQPSKYNITFIGLQTDLQIHT